MFGKERGHQHPARDRSQADQIVGIDVDEVGARFATDKGDGIVLDDQERASNVQHGGITPESRADDNRIVDRRQRRQEQSRGAQKEVCQPEAPNRSSALS